MQPVSQAILVDSFPREKQGMAMAIYGMGVVVAPTIGPTLGGWITDNYSWRWIFLLNVPIGIVSLALISMLIHEKTKAPSAAERKNFRIDFVGLGLLAVGLGFLQVVLDKGQRDDWFGSPFIVWGTVTFVVALVAMFIWEWRVKNPVIDLHLFGDRNFAISTFMMYTLGFVLYSTTLLLPILMQTLMGYTAMESGLVLLPGGLLLLTMLPFVGILLGKFSPRWIVLMGLIVMATGLFSLSHLNLDATGHQMMFDWAISRVGTAFLFVPINVMAFYFVPKNKMNNASGLINLARNMGASTGISFVTTMLDRRAQYHQDVLAGNLRSTNPMLRHALYRITHMMMTKGPDAVHAATQAQGMIYGQLQRQAMVFSFVDNFRMMAIICVAVIPLIFVMRGRSRSRDGGAPPVH
jgi:DHA2 family multidrug resistance protein